MKILRFLGMILLSFAFWTILVLMSGFVYEGLMFFIKWFWWLIIILVIYFILKTR